MFKDAKSAVFFETVLIIFLAVLNVGNIPSFFSLVSQKYAPSFPFSSAGIPNPLQSLLTAVLTFLCLSLVFLGTAFYIKGKESERTARLRRIILIVIILLTVGLPQLLHSAIRITSGNLQFTHDGGICYTEEAARYLIKGENPYSESYLGTSVETKFANDPFWRTQSFRHILDHYPYLPLPFLSAAPFLGIFELLGMPFDQRFVYFPMLLLLLYIFPKLFSESHKNLSTALFFLNPAVSMYLVRGTTDLIFYLPVFLFFFYAVRKNWKAASLFLGLACICKQFAWFLIPFFFFYAAPLKIEKAGVKKYKFSSFKVLWRAFYPLILVMTAVLGFFLLWDKKSFLDDVLLFNFGLSGASYPFGGTPGYGFANVLLSLGIVPDVQSDFPLWIFQIPLFLPLLIFSLYRIWKKKNMNELVILFSASMFVFLYFSRMFHFNYFGMLFTFLLTGCFISSARSESESFSAA